MSDDKLNEGVCQKSIVKCPHPWGLICFIIDIVLPGIGTIISSFFDETLNVTALLFGFLQLATCWFAVGWVWSIYQGYMIYNKSVGL